MSVAQGFSDPAVAEAASSAAPSIAQIYADHCDFVWACLQRFGVVDGDLDDASQEVFLVVHRRLASFRAEAELKTWLYAICLRVALAFRRRKRRRRELELPEAFDAVDAASPEDDLTLLDRRRVLTAVLDELDLEKRALIVMYEIDELGCDEIAGILGVPIGTVYSRLHAARRAFEKSVARLRARAWRRARP